MSTINKVKKVLSLIRAMLPSAVPIGRTEFNAWSSSIISLYNFPDNDSVRFALATMVMHLDATSAFRSKWTFAKMLRAGAAKQVASSVFQEIKLKQQEAAKLEATQLQATPSGSTR